MPWWQPSACFGCEELYSLRTCILSALEMGYRMSGSEIDHHVNVHPSCCLPQQYSTMKSFRVVTAEPMEQSCDCFGGSSGTWQWIAYICLLRISNSIGAK